MEANRIIQGDCLEQLKLFKENSIDSIVTDPPCGINFSSFGDKDHWDSDKGGRDQWISWMSEVVSECLRVIKPGGHAFVWAYPRTSHWTTIAIENAGWQIRNKKYHLSSQSMSAAHPLDSVRSGWKTANVKPVVEEWIWCQKPISEKTVAANMQRWGVGGMNVSQVQTSGKRFPSNFVLSHCPECDLSKGFCLNSCSLGHHNISGWLKKCNICGEQTSWVCSVALLNQQSGITKSGKGVTEKQAYAGKSSTPFPRGATNEGNQYGDIGGASRFFECLPGDTDLPFKYVPRTMKADRTMGGRVENNHPTVKPQPLLRYLAKLITPPNGIILDPFGGSGSMALAALSEDFRYILIEQSTEYIKIAEERIRCWKEDSLSDIQSIGEERCLKAKQINLFDV